MHHRFRMAYHLPLHEVFHWGSHGRFVILTANEYIFQRWLFSFTSSNPCGFSLFQWRYLVKQFGSAFLCFPSCSGIELWYPGFQYVFFYNFLLSPTTDGCVRIWKLTCAYRVGRKRLGFHDILQKRIHRKLLMPLVLVRFTIVRVFETLTHFPHNVVTPFYCPAWRAFNAPEGRCWQLPAAKLRTGASCFDIMRKV